MMNVRIIDNASSEYKDFLTEKISQYNKKTFGIESTPIAFVLTEENSERIIAASWGRIIGNWMHSELTWVDEDYRSRNFGTEIIKVIQSAARERGAIGLYCDSFNEKAAAAFKRMGYMEFGRIDDQPIGRAHIYLLKRF